MNTNLPISKAMVARTILFFLAWLNQALVLKGYGALPFDDAQLEFGVTTAITFALSLWTYWKNNDVTRKARKAALFVEQKGLK